jgi:hypothetical protein
MSKVNEIAFCGLFCGACKIYICNQNETLDKLSMSSKIPIDLLKCQGCRSDINSLYCRNCAMKKCCQKKGLFSCADCDEFPCSVLQAFESDQHLHHKRLIDILELLKQKGNEEWLMEQTNRWNCKNCGSACSWYDTNCPNCDEKFDGLKQN